MKILKATIRVYGTIQGVGFRPFIYKKATKFNLNGFILNDGLGVFIEVEGKKEIIDIFVNEIKRDKPPLAIIDSIEINFSACLSNYENFIIKESEVLNTKATIMPIDSAMCSECVSELNNKSNHRFNYPFINCTNCGPRYTIIEKLPYDRDKTSMKKFQMCDSCKSEYEDKSDRRFHAEPISCPNCGPTLTLFDKNFNFIAKNTKAIKEVVNLIKDGHIIAIKGYGGFHLVCDGMNEKAIAKLREIKVRKRKPFALMCKNISEVKKYANLSLKEKDLLTSPIAPIVLLKKKNSNLPEIIAPNIDKLGIFLPYTPIHYLIFKTLNSPLIVTSANTRGEPIISDKNEFKNLNLSDYILDYDRDIINPCDDSIMMVVENRTFVLRRGRGFAPSNVKLKLKDSILALGANQKNSIAIGFDDNIILSPYIGDLETVKSVDLFTSTIDKFKTFYNLKPQILVCDKHPEYESTKWAKSQSEKLIQIQHHYAHALSVMVEHNLNKKVLAIIWDGTGFGDDGNLWGGEFFIADFNGYKRILHFDYLKLIGGAKAIKEPRRISLSILFEIYGKDAITLDNPTIKAFSKFELENLYLMYSKNLNSPLSSSVGRIFDGIASISGVLQFIDYEGEAGSILEKFYDESIQSSFSLKIQNNIVQYKNIFREILIDKEPKLIVSKFINSLIELILNLSNRYNLPIVFSGGVFQNRVILNLLIEKLKEKEVYFNQNFPSNDGGISLGQVGFFKKKFV